MSRYVDDAAEGSGSEAAHEDDYAYEDEDGADRTLDGFINDGSGSDSGSGSGGEEPGVRPRLPGDESSDGESARNMVASMRRRHGRSRRVRPGDDSRHSDADRGRGRLDADSGGSDVDNGGGGSDEDSDAAESGQRATQDAERMETDHSDDEEGGPRRPPRHRARATEHAFPMGHVELTQDVELVGMYDRYLVPCVCVCARYMMLRGGHCFGPTVHRHSFRQVPRAVCVCMCSLHDVARWALFWSNCAPPQLSTGTSCRVCVYVLVT